MASQSIAYTRRQIGRAKATAELSLQGPDDALKAYAPDMLEQVALYTAADRAATEAELAASKEVGEGLVALAALRPVFDETRVLVAAKVGTTYEAASAFGTPDDLLNVAEDLEAELAGITADWAQTISPRFTQAVEAATKEYEEGGEALKIAQKAVLQRAQAEGALRPVLVNFRRLVRLKFGATSREYRELLDRRSRGGDDPGDEGGAAR